MSTNKIKICLFGTSANPPTGLGGHTGIVSSLASIKSTEKENTPKFDEIRVLPVYKHMFTEKRNQRNQASFDHRMEMCKLAFRDIPNVKVSDYERALFDHVAKERGITSEEKKAELRLGTFDLINFLNKQNEIEGINEEYTLAMGADTFMDLTSFKWRNSKEVIQLVEGRFVVKLRLSDDSYTESEILERIESVKKDIQNGIPSFEMNVQLLTSAASATSSSAARESCDEKVLATLLDEKVIEYIKMNRLYKFDSL